MKAVHAFTKYIIFALDLIPSGNIIIIKINKCILSGVIIFYVNLKVVEKVDAKKLLN